jgi:hypothetical protein
MLAFGFAVFTAAAPAAAGATTWCVKDPTCPPSGNASQTTIQGAINAAAP